LDRVVWQGCWGFCAQRYEHRPCGCAHKFITGRIGSCAGVLAGRRQTPSVLTSRHAKHYCREQVYVPESYVSSSDVMDTRTRGFLAGFLRRILRRILRVFKGKTPNVESKITTFSTPLVLSDE